MKKVFEAILILAMIFSLAACGGKAPTENPEDGENSSSAGIAFPEKEITLIVGSGAGGGLDMMSRTLQPEMAKILGVDFVVENMKGGAGSVAMQHVIDLNADGYTLYTNSVDLILNDCMGKIEYTRKDLVPVCRVQMDQSILWVRSDSPFETMEDLVDYAKDNPGKLNFSGSQAAGIDEVVCCSLFNAAEISCNYIPYESGSESMAALLGGHVDVAHEEPAAAMAQYQAGEIRPIVVCTEERLDAFPDTPTARELGYDVTLGNWRGIFVKAGTDPEIVQKLQNAIVTAMESEAYKQFAAKSLLDLRPGYADTEAFTAFLDEQYDIYHKILEDLGYL